MNHKGTKTQREPISEAINQVAKQIIAFAESLLLQAANHRRQKIT